MLTSYTALFLAKQEKLMAPPAKRTTKSPKTSETDLAQDEACANEPATRRTERAAAITEFRSLASC
jgi:hypothetical protein